MSDEENIYSDDNEKLVRNDEISPEEAAFMRGYNEADEDEEEDELEEE